MFDLDGIPQTFLRFGLQRKKAFLKDVRGAYHGLVLPANILLYQYRSTPSLVFMCEKPFFVDPMTYLFGQPYEGFKKRVKKGPRFKPSFEKLMLGHGLDPTDFLPHDYPHLLSFLEQSDRNLVAFTRNALLFQWNHVWDTIAKAEDLMSDEQQAALREEDFRPRILIPPYFLFEPDSATSTLNEQILDHCWERRESWPGDLFPLIFVRKTDLGSAYFGEIVRIARKHDFDGYCIWIEDFDERFATEMQARNLIELVKRLSQGGRQIVALYGGFFTMLLEKYGVTCVCHGLGYGEARSVGASAQQGSGPAPVRYYVLELHRHLTLPDALLVLRSRPDLMCSCPACRRVLRGDPERVTLFEHEEHLAEMHFLFNRGQERKMISASTRAEMVEHLKWSLQLNEDIGKIKKQYRISGRIKERPIVDPTYLRDWKSALEAVEN